MDNSDPTIALYGINGVYNYGCEAIVRGTEIILNEIWPDANIRYISPRPKDDKKRLKECNVKVIPRKMHHLLSFNGLNNLLAYKTGFYMKNIFNEDIDWIEDCDFIFSIGGDIYTLPPNYTEKKYKKYYNSIIHWGEIIKKREKKLVIWGASIGPFDNNLQTEKIFTDHLKNVDLIVSREHNTTSYLKKLQVNENVIECPDPAFIIPKSPEKTLNAISPRNNIRIGINFSPLSVMYGQINKNFFFQENIKIITNLVRKLNAEILLIPHVICDFNINDDDLRYLMGIKDNLPSDISNFVEIVDDDPGFIGIKEKLLTCNIIIAARMHCAINSITLGIPTIFISYSQKSKGMVEYVYGNSDWILNLNDMNSKNLLMKVVSMQKQEKSIKTHLKNFMEKITPNSYLNLIKNV
jgi:polysaccharide pyruvyl transferase WcaK-like protein